MLWVGWGVGLGTAAIAAAVTVWQTRKTSPTSTAALLTANSEWVDRVLHDNELVREELRHVRDELARLTEHVKIIELELAAERSDVAEYRELHGPLRRRSTD